MTRSAGHAEYTAVLLYGGLRTPMVASGGRSSYFVFCSASEAQGTMIGAGRASLKAIEKQLSYTPKARRLNSLSIST
jgi:hypothetical protein